MSDRFPGFVDRKEPFQTLWLLAKVVSALGWAGVAISCLMLFVVVSEKGDFSRPIEWFVDSLLLILGGGIVRILVAIERNTRTSR
jgi:hypothetical protein